MFSLRKVKERVKSCINLLKKPLMINLVNSWRNIYALRTNQRLNKWISLNRNQVKSVWFDCKAKALEGAKSKYIKEICLIFWKFTFSFTAKKRMAKGHLIEFNLNVKDQKNIYHFCLIWLNSNFQLLTIYLMNPVRPFLIWFAVF